MKMRLTVLVTGVGGRSFGHQILHALLLLGDKYRIVVTDAMNFSYGLYQADSRYIVPLASSPDYIRAIERLVEHESIDVILPGTEPEISAFAAHHDALASKCLVIVSPAPVVEICQSKKVLYAWLEEHNFKIPRTVTAPHWEALVRECGFPIVGKPTEATGGSRNVALLNDKDEVNNYLQELPPDQIIFQEYVGSAEEEYTVGVMVSREGKIIDSIVIHRKLVGLSLGVSRKIKDQSYALSTGYSQGFVIRHPLIQSACEALALETGIRGPANIQLRLVGDQVTVFEVHPRFSGTTSIRADVGFNEPDVLIRNYLFGESFDRLDYQTDVAAIRAFSNLIVPASAMQSVPKALEEK